MTYKELIKREIERLYKHYLDAQEFDSGYNMALDAILKFIESIPEEPTSEDLEEEICSFFSKNPIPCEHITDWPLLKNCAIHFFELGLKVNQKGE